jgi:hypothetical protein
VTDRFVRKVSRITRDWAVEAQSLIDARYRRTAKTLRRLRRHDPELATRLEAAIERARVEGDGHPERILRTFELFVEAERDAEGEAATILAKLEAESPGYMEEVVRTVERGVERVAALSAPSDIAAEHAALVAAQREYVEALRRLVAAYAGDAVTAVAAAVDDVERTRTKIDAAFARLAR